MEIMQTHHTNEKGNYVSLKSSHVSYIHISHNVKEKKNSLLDKLITFHKI